MLDAAPMSATDESLLLHNCHVTNELALNQLALKKYPLFYDNTGLLENSNPDNIPASPVSIYLSTLHKGSYPAYRTTP